MTVQILIEAKISDNIMTNFLQVDNESHRHAVPANSETHFKVVIVSDDFHGMSLIARHRLVNGLLKEELDGPVHALSLHTYTPSEWHVKNKNAMDSAGCLGGGK